MSYELNSKFIEQATRLFDEMEIDTAEIPCPYDTPRAFFDLYVKVKGRKSVITNWRNDTSLPKLADVWPR